jgi:stage II sporulation protein D
MQVTLSKHTSMRIIVAVAIALTTLVSLAGDPVQAAEDEVVFDGAGWGHGVGMSQYGAYGRAVAGQSHEDILLAYYGDGGTTKIGTLGEGGVPELRNIFTNVASDSTATTLTATYGGGDGTVMTIARLGAEALSPVELTAGDKVVITDTTPNSGDPGGCTASLTVSGVLIEWEAGSCDFDITLHAGAGRPEELIKATNCRTRNCTFGYGTTLHVVDNGSPQRSAADLLGSGIEYPGFDLVVESSLDNYTRGIAEVQFSWPSETLQAQAIAARSYAASFVARANPTNTSYDAAGCYCDVKNDSAYQVYAGWMGDRPSVSNWEAAASATSGKVLTHPDAPDSGFIRAYYASSNGGATEWVKDKWGSDLPYLVSVPDEYSLVSANPFRSWTVNKAPSAVVDAIWGTSADYTLTSAEVVARNVSGSAKTVRFSGSDADGSTITKDVSSATVTSKFRLWSWYFDISYAELPPPPPPPPPPPVSFDDIGETVHKDDIEYLADLGVALACDDGPNSFCPDDRMRREDLAAFVVRALELPPTSTDYFHDDDGLPFEDDINALAEARITLGCNPPTNDKFCPDSTVTRGQTAAFIVRAWSLTNAGEGDRFTDDDSSVFEGDIDRLAFAGITKGCNPPNNTRYCPDRLLTRAEMSSFLARALRSL